MYIRLISKKNAERMKKKNAHAFSEHRFDESIFDTPVHEVKRVSYGHCGKTLFFVLQDRSYVPCEFVREMRTRLADFNCVGVLATKEQAEEVCKEFGYEDFSLLGSNYFKLWGQPVIVTCQRCCVFVTTNKNERYKARIFRVDGWNVPEYFFVKKPHDLPKDTQDYGNV